MLSGDVNIVGTSFAPSSVGGVVRLDGVNSTTLTHAPKIFDGISTAFFVVPEPTTALLFGMGLTSLAVRRRYRVTPNC